MKMNSFGVISALALGSFALTSCETPVGQGAGIGAATGAIIGGAATGHVRGAAIGAAIGAGTGALVGAAIQEDEAARYGSAPSNGYPYARSTGNYGFVQSPYTGRTYDVRGIPRNGLVRDIDTNQLFRKP